MSHGILKHSVGGPRRGCKPVQIRCPRLFFAEEEFQRLLPVAQDRRQGTATPPDKTQFVAGVRVLPRHGSGKPVRVAQRGRGGLCQRIVANAPTVPPQRFQDPGRRQFPQHVDEQPPVPVVHVEPDAQLIGIRHGTGHPPPSEIFQGFQHVTGRKPLKIAKRRGPTLRSHPLIVQISREGRNASRNPGRRRERSGRRFPARQPACAPHYFMEQVFGAFNRDCQDPAVGALDGISQHLADRRAVRRVDLKVARHRLGHLAMVVGCADPRSAEDPIRPRRVDVQRFEAERHVRGFESRPLRGAGRREHLEAPVQQERVHGHVLTRAGLWVLDFADSLSVRGPQVLQLAERRPQHNANPGFGSVVAVDILLLERCSQSIGNHAVRCPRHRLHRDQPCRRVQRPCINGAAVDLHAAFGRIGTAEDCHLKHGRAACGRIVALGFGDHQGVAELHIQDRPRTVGQGQGRGRRKDGAGHHNPSKHGVVREPGRAGRLQVGLETHLACGRLPPRSENVPRRLDRAPCFAANPIPPALERIPRHGHEAPMLRPKQRTQLDGQPRAVGRRRGQCKLFGRIRIPTRTTQAGNDRGRSASFRGIVRPRHGDHGAENGMGSDFDNRIHSGVRQRLDARLELDRAAGLPPPVGLIQGLRRLKKASRNVAHERQRRRTNPKGGCLPLQSIQNGIHQGTVVAGTRTKASYANTAGAEGTFDGIDPRGAPADNLMRGIVGRDRQGCTLQFLAGGRDRGLDFGTRRENRGHGSGLRQLRHQLAARRRETKRILPSQRSGGRGRRDFAQTVADYEGRPHTQTGPQPRQRMLQRENRRLCPGRIIQSAFGPGLSEHDIQQRPIPGDIGLHPCIAPVQRSLENGLRRVQVLSHAFPLTGLAGEGKGHRARTGGLYVPFGEQLQLFPQCRDVVEDRRGPEREAGPAGGCGPGHVRQPFHR